MSTWRILARASSQDDFFYPHVAEREWARKLSGVPFIKAQICFMGAPSYDLITSPKALPPNTITLDVEISAYEFWGGHKSVVHNNRRVHYKWKSIARKIQLTI